MNVDLKVPEEFQVEVVEGEIRGVVYGDMRHMGDASHGVHVLDGVAELVLLNHSLHYVTPDDADLVLDEVVRILEPGGEVVIVEPDVLEILVALNDYESGFSAGDDERVAFVLSLISDDLEPTDEGKVLRWATWFGERRSLWSADSLAQRLNARGLKVWQRIAGADPEWAGSRTLESFSIKAAKR